MPSGRPYELFVDSGGTCTERESSNDGSPPLCGILGFISDRSCGSVVSAATQDVIASCDAIDDAATRGWVAELTNELVGRFKSSLFRHGAVVAMSIPVVLTATQLMPLPRTQIQPIRLVIGNDAVAIWLEAEALLELSGPGADLAVAAEAEAMLI